MEYQVTDTSGIMHQKKCPYFSRAVTLYDKPPAMFRPISLKEKHDFLKKMSHNYDAFLGEGGSTILTKEEQGNVELKPRRPAFIVSSTSWTEDEDFFVLFKALQGEKK